MAKRKAKVEAVRAIRASAIVLGGSIVARSTLSNSQVREMPSGYYDCRIIRESDYRRLLRSKCK